MRYGPTRVRPGVIPAEGPSAGAGVPVEPNPTVSDGTTLRLARKSEDVADRPVSAGSFYRADGELWGCQDAVRNGVWADSTPRAVEPDRPAQAGRTAGLQPRLVT